MSSRRQIRHQMIAEPIAVSSPSGRTCKFIGAARSGAMALAFIVAITNCFRESVRKVRLHFYERSREAPQLEFEATLAGKKRAVDCTPNCSPQLTRTLNQPIGAPSFHAEAHTHPNECIRVVAEVGSAIAGTQPPILR